MAETNRVYCEFPNKDNQRMCAESVDYIYIDRGVSGYLCDHHHTEIRKDRDSQNRFCQFIFDRYANRKR